jgi:hypothetical protein
MTLVGIGLTPSYKLRYRAAADVLPFPLPVGFDFPLEEDKPESGTGMLSPRNNFTISAPTPRIYNDEEIQQFQAGVVKRIYMWGIVHYEDAFGIPRYVKFAQNILWLADGKSTTGFNTPRHNSAN